MTTTDHATLAAKIWDAWIHGEDTTTKGAACALSSTALNMLAITAAEVATEHLDAQKPRPLAVGDRVRVLSPVVSNGARAPYLTEGDVGITVTEANEDGDIWFHRDGTEGTAYVAAANVERIDDDEAPDGSISARRLKLPDGSVIHAGGIEGAPAVGDTVRIDKAERADGETIWLPEADKEYRVLSAADSGGDLVTEKDEDGYHRIVAARNVTIVKRAER